jgi:hypothetical protein
LSGEWARAESCWFYFRTSSGVDPGVEREHPFTKTLGFVVGGGGGFGAGARALDIGTSTEPVGHLRQMGGRGRTPRVDARSHPRCHAPSSPGFQLPATCGFSDGSMPEAQRALAGVGGEVSEVEQLDIGTSTEPVGDLRQMGGRVISLCHCWSLHPGCQHASSSGFWVRGAGSTSSQSALTRNDPGGGHFLFGELDPHPRCPAPPCTGFRVRGACTQVSDQGERRAARTYLGHARVGSHQG